jgi:hypothetical protein
VVDRRAVRRRRTPSDPAARSLTLASASSGSFSRLDRFVGVTEIRSLRPDDLPRVVELLDALLPDWGGDIEFLRATLLDHPWADPEVTSLVAADDDGRMTGFIGAQVRRLRFGDRELRGVCCSHLVVEPQRRAGAAGALLVGRLLNGPQAATWSDSASDTVARIWRTYNGELDHSRACDWMLVLQPARWIASWIKATLRREALGRDVTPVGSFPFHTVARRRLLATPADAEGEDASAKQIVEALPQLVAGKRLYVDYDAQHLDYLLSQIRSHSGEVVCRIVRLRDRPIGWYVYLPRRARASRVLHLSGSPRHVDAVLGELIQDAMRRGVHVLAGRLEPHLDQPLQRRLAAVGLARSPVIHVRDAELRATLAGQASLLTQLDSEWFVT